MVEKLYFYAHAVWLVSLCIDHKRDVGIELLSIDNKINTSSIEPLPIGTLFIILMLK